MSKKHHRNTPPPAPEPVAQGSRTRLYLLTGLAGLAILVGIAGLVWLAAAPKKVTRSEAELAALQRPHAASVGNPAAPVHIVEFLDPACETCAQFYPYVKDMMKAHPGDIRLSLRLVAFHRNADIATKALEAAKLQGKFFEVLERLFATQGQWVVAHTVDPDRLWTLLRSMDLDAARLQADMESPAVLQNLAADFQDARTLKVTATPEYFVNGRGLPEFGLQPLRALVGDEVKKVKR